MKNLIMYGLLWKKLPLPKILNCFFLINMTSVRHKLEYIKRHHEILTVEMNIKIYTLVKRCPKSLSAIRETNNGDIYIDLKEINNNVIIETIYIMVKERKIEIKI